MVVWARAWRSQSNCSRLSQAAATHGAGGLQSLRNAAPAPVMVHVGQGRQDPLPSGWRVSHDLKYAKVGREEPCGFMSCRGQHRTPLAPQTGGVDASVADGVGGDQ